MTVIVCLDDRGGMTFNRRRQSQDRRVREQVVRLVQGRRIWMNSYSAGQFEEAFSELRVDEDFLEKAEVGDFCFVENLPVLPYEGSVESVIVFKWNRVYPSDQKLDLDLGAHPWHRTQTEEFAGYSHEKITMEVYTK